MVTVIQIENVKSRPVISAAICQQKNLANQRPKIRGLRHGSLFAEALVSLPVCMHVHLV
jgi:hypothetical protein